jgi:hypothetical protein
MLAPFMLCSVENVNRNYENFKRFVAIGSECPNQPGVICSCDEFVMGSGY